MLNDNDHLFIVKYDISVLMMIENSRGKNTFRPYLSIASSKFFKKIIVQFVWMSINT